MPAASKAGFKVGSGSEMTARWWPLFSLLLLHGALPTTALF